MSEEKTYTHLTWKKKFLNPELVAKLIPHSKYYEGNLFDRHIQKLRIKTAIEFIGDIKEKKILDAGCGDGYFLKEISYLNADFYGCDISKTRILRTEKKTNARLSIQDLEKTSYPSDYFDIVLCMDVLEHTINPEKVIEELQRITKTKGKIIVSVPTESLWILLRLITLNSPFNVDHYHNISKRKLVRWFNHKPEKEKMLFGGLIKVYCF